MWYFKWRVTVASCVIRIPWGEVQVPTSTPGYCLTGKAANKGCKTMPLMWMGEPCGWTILDVPLLARTWTTIWWVLTACLQRTSSWNRVSINTTSANRRLPIDHDGQFPHVLVINRYLTWVVLGSQVAMFSCQELVIAATGLEDKYFFVFLMLLFFSGQQIHDRSWWCNRSRSFLKSQHWHVL